MADTAVAPTAATKRVVVFIDHSLCARRTSCAPVIER
jgi:hypothetical protein